MRTAQGVRVMMNPALLLVIENIVPACLLVADAICDIKRREIILGLTISVIGAGIVWRAAIDPESFYWVLFGLTPGSFMLFTSLITQGGTGKGDAIVLFAAGVWLGGARTWMIVLTALLFAALFAVVLQIGRCKVRELPFVPFLLAAFLLNEGGLWLM